MAWQAIEYPKQLNIAIYICFNLKWWQVSIFMLSILNGAPNVFSGLHFLRGILSCTDVFHFQNGNMFKILLRFWFMVCAAFHSIKNSISCIDNYKKCVSSTTLISTTSENPVTLSPVRITWRQNEWGINFYGVCYGTGVYAL